MDAQSSLSCGTDLSSRPHKIKKQIFSTDRYENGKSLAPVVGVVVVVVAVVRLLLGGEDSRTRGERARFRVHGKGRHISTLLLYREQRGGARKKK